MALGHSDLGSRPGATNKPTFACCGFLGYTQASKDPVGLSYFPHH